MSLPALCLCLANGYEIHFIDVWQVAPRDTGTSRAGCLVHWMHVLYSGILAGLPQTIVLSDYLLVGLPGITNRNDGAISNETQTCNRKLTAINIIWTQDCHWLHDVRIGSDFQRMPTVFIFSFSSFITARCTLVQARYCDRMSSVCPSVRPSVCDVGELWSHRLEFFKNNFTVS